jgi:hypothetical protein
MADITKVPLFKGVLTHPATKYVGVPIRDGALGAFIRWLDATSSATITLELTGMGSGDAPVETAGSAAQWVDSGETITGPAATAAGSSMINLENVRQRRARLKIVTAAHTDIEIWDGTAG